jgi:AraC-like DNA-binding protein
LAEDSSALVPLSRVWSFFDSAARREDPLLGWLVGARVGDQKLGGALRRKLETAPTLLRALQDLARLSASEASDIDMGILERQDEIRFYTHYPNLRQVPGYTISQAYQLGVILDLVRHFLGRNWVPTKIGLESRRVPPAVENLFPGSRVLGQQQAGYIAVPRSALHQAAHPTLRRGADANHETLISRLDYVDTLRSVLRSYLSEGYPSQRFAAELMNTSVRTLTRRLAAHDLTYGVIVDDLRFEVAKEHLQNADMPIVEIAQYVGFRDQSDFTRMFRRVGGLTPGRFRKTIKGGN